MNSKNTYGWERLNCPFFTSACHRVLSPYLEEQGFAEKEVGSIGEIIYKRFDVFLEIGYEPETCPNYSPTVVLGLGDSKYDDAGRPAGVPLWYLLPQGHSEKTGKFWTFKTEADLERMLTEIKTQFLEPHAKPLWLDMNKLEKHIENFRTKL